MITRHLRIEEHLKAMASVQSQDATETSANALLLIDGSMSPPPTERFQDKVRYQWSRLNECPSARGPEWGLTPFPITNFQFSGNQTNKTLKFAYSKTVSSFPRAPPAYGFTVSAAILSSVPWKLTYDLIFQKGKTRKGMRRWRHSEEHLKLL